LFSNIARINVLQKLEEEEEKLINKEITEG